MKTTEQLIRLWKRTDTPEIERIVREIIDAACTSDDWNEGEESKLSHVLFESFKAGYQAGYLTGYEEAYEAAIAQVGGSKADG